MNILLWVLQILLALWNLIGGIYTFSNYDKIKSAWAAHLPPFFWMAIAVLQVFFALGLVLPGLVGMPKLICVSATYLAVYALSGLVLSAQYAGFPGMLWGVIPALLAAFVAYGRMG
jgi:hypothetical protein